MLYSLATFSQCSAQIRDGKSFCGDNKANLKENRKDVI